MANLKFEYNGQSYNTADRSVSGQSAREYWSSITGQPKEKFPGSSSSVKNLDDAKNFINSEQSVSTQASTPEIRSSLKKYQDITKEELGYSTKDLEAPALPNFEQSYLQLRQDKGLVALEDSLGSLQSEADSVKTQFYINKNSETGKSGMIAQNVVEGRVGEHEKAANERLMILDDQITTINNQLNTAYGVINSIMQYKGMDYDAAVKNYDTKFSNAMSMINAVKGIDESIKSDKERAQDIARANLQIMYNSISENSEGWQSLSSSQQTQISKMELQSGLPQGFFKTIQAKNPGGEIVTTNSYSDDSGKQYSAVVIRDPKTGKLTTQNIYVGQGKTSASDSSNLDKEDKEISSFRNDAATLQMRMSSSNPTEKISWSQAWQNLRTKYPQASTELIDQTLGLDNRAKYDK